MVDVRPRRRRLAISMRTLLAAIFAMAIGLGWWGTAARNQEAAVAGVTTSSYAAGFGYDDDPEYWPERTPWTRRVGRVLKSWIPGRLKAAVGRDYFDTLLAISVEGGEPGGEARDREAIRRFARVRSLDQLNLNVEVIDADVAQLARLPALWWLEFCSSSPGLTDVSMRQIAGMRRLEHLLIRDAPITDKGLAALEAARGLAALSVGVVGMDPQAPGAIAIKGEGFARLARLTTLTTLSVQSPAMTGEGFRYLGRLTHLKELHVDCHSLADDDLRSLGTLAELESLELVSSSIDGTGFRHLAGLRKLKHVTVNGTNVGDAAIPCLARLPALEQLQLDGSRVTASGLEALRSSRRLKGLSVQPAMTGDTNRLIQALPGCQILNGGAFLPRQPTAAPASR